MKMLLTSSVFLVVLLLLRRKKKKKIFEAFQNSSLKRQRVKTGIYRKLQHAYSFHEFAKAFNYNNFTASNV